MKQIGAEGLTADQEKILYTSIVNGLSIYESLNSVEEFPDYFEESLNDWATNLYNILEDTSDNSPEEFIMAKKGSVSVICLLVGRFGEFMNEYTEPFFTKIWEMMKVLPAEKVYNEFVTSMTEYLSVSLRDKKSAEFMRQNMGELFAEFLVNHLNFNENDLEEFELNEEGFIQMDLEENDKETRRRSCVELMKVSFLN